MLAVKEGVDATPLEFVMLTAVVDPLNAPLGPVTGAVKVTLTPLMGLPVESLTVA